MNDIEKKHFLSGFYLAGQRQPNGTLKAYLGDSVINNWPKEVEMAGNVYTFEYVVDGDDGYESAIYV
jgi:hypothetical protein